MMIMMIVFDVSPDGDFRERAVHERSPGVASDSNFRSVRETMGRLCRSQTEDGEEMEDVCLNGGSCTSMEDQEEDALFCRSVDEQMGEWVGWGLLDGWMDG